MTLKLPLKDSNFEVVLVDVNVDLLAVGDVNLASVLPAVAAVNLGGFDPVTTVVVDEAGARPGGANLTVVLGLAAVALVNTAVAGTTDGAVGAAKAEGKLHGPHVGVARGVRERSAATEVHLLAGTDVLVVIGEGEANGRCLVDLVPGALGHNTRVGNRDVETANVDLVLSGGGAVNSDFKVVLHNIDVHVLAVADVNLAGVAPAVAAGDGGGFYPVTTVVVDEARARPGAANLGFVLGLAACTVGTAELESSFNGAHAVWVTRGVREVGAATNHELFAGTDVLAVVAKAEANSPGADLFVAVLGYNAVELGRYIEAANVVVVGHAGGSSDANFEVEFVESNVDALAVGNVNLAGVAPAVAAGDFGGFDPVATVVVDEARTRPGAANRGFVLGLAARTIGTADLELQGRGAPFSRSRGVGERNTTADHELFVGASTDVAGVVIQAEANCRSLVDLFPGTLGDGANVAIPDGDVKTANVIVGTVVGYRVPGGRGRSGVGSRGGSGTGSGAGSGVGSRAASGEGSGGRGGLRSTVRNGLLVTRSVMVAENAGVGVVAHANAASAGFLTMPLLRLGLVNVYVGLAVGVLAGSGSTDLLAFVTVANGSGAGSSEEHSGELHK